MGEMQEGQFKSPLVRSGKNKGRIRNPLVAQEIVNTIFESKARPKKVNIRPEDDQNSGKFKLTAQKTRALIEKGSDDTLILQASKTVEEWEKSRIDELTGLRSKHSARGTVDDAIREIANSKEKLSLGWLRLDLNFFSWMNDIYEAHDMGDVYLTFFANQLKKLISSSDIGFRMGGDEFGILIQGNFSYKDFEKVTNRIQNGLNKNMMEELFNHVLTSERIIKPKKGKPDKESTILIQELLLGVNNLKNNIHDRRNHFLESGRGSKAQKEIMLKKLDAINVDEFNMYIAELKTYDELNDAEKNERKNIEKLASKVLVNLFSNFGVCTAGVYVEHPSNEISYDIINTIADRDVYTIKRESEIPQNEQMYPLKIKISSL